ncbi:hypothetical protein AAKU55_004553 [Oxalobacteraceae bacterium GrIS 1.11]
MDRNINGIDFIVDQIKSTDIQNHHKEYKKDHIFHLLLKYCEAQEIEPARMSMMHHFDLYQKYFSHVKKNNKNMSLLQNSSRLGI